MTDPVKLEAVAWKVRQRHWHEDAYDLEYSEPFHIDGQESEPLTPLATAQAEIDRLRGLADELSGLLATTQLCAEMIEARALAAEAKVVRMREALKPFANVLETYRAMSPKHRRVTAINISHLRAARQALQDTQDA